LIHDISPFGLDVVKIKRLAGNYGSLKVLYQIGAVISKGIGCLGFLADVNAPRQGHAGDAGKPALFVLATPARTG
jgi:hypothetical protein